MQKLKKIHFVGIKGVGMTPLAIIAKEAKVTVTGSDVAEEFITDESLKKAGITPLVGFSEAHITKDIDLVITTGAHGGYDNVEVKKAKELQIPVMSKGEAVGAYVDGSILGKEFKGIAVAGSHGKTTTSGMLVSLFQKAGNDPSYVVGTSKIGELLLPGHFGKGEYFIAESDEYATEPQYDHTAQFLWQHPQIALFTNIELDHPDIYPNVEAVAKVFEKFASQVKEDGVIIGCGDDQRVLQILKNTPRKAISYGFSPANDYVLKRVHISGSQTFFRVESKGIDLGEFRLQVSGEHYALNAVGAMLVAMECGLPLEKIKEALFSFTGTKRRLEYKGQLVSGAHIFDDYGHHPTEIQKTLHALRLRYPQEKIICIFQPHTYSRTKALFQEFARSFDDADEVMLVEIFPSAREEKDPTVSSQLLSLEVAKRKPHVLYLKNLDEVRQEVVGKPYKDNTVLVFMGAGDIYQVIESLSFVKK